MPKNFIRIIAAFLPVILLLDPAPTKAFADSPVGKNSPAGTFSVFENQALAASLVAAFRKRPLTPSIFRLAGAALTLWALHHGPWPHLVQDAMLLGVFTTKENPNPSPTFDSWLETHAMWNPHDPAATKFRIPENITGYAGKMAAQIPPGLEIAARGMRLDRAAFNRLIRDGLQPAEKFGQRNQFSPSIAAAFETAVMPKGRSFPARDYISVVIIAFQNRLEMNALGAQLVPSGLPLSAIPFIFIIDKTTGESVEYRDLLHRLTAADETGAWKKEWRYQRYIAWLETMWAGIAGMSVAAGLTLAIRRFNPSSNSAALVTLVFQLIGVGGVAGLINWLVFYFPHPPERRNKFISDMAAGSALSGIMSGAAVYIVIYLIPSSYIRITLFAALIPAVYGSLIHLLQNLEQTSLPSARDLAPLWQDLRGSNRFAIRERLDTWLADVPQKRRDSWVYGLELMLKDILANPSSYPLEDWERTALEYILKNSQKPFTVRKGPTYDRLMAMMKKENPIGRLFRQTSA